MFGGKFDFNRDGKTDAFEMTLGLNVVFGEEKDFEDNLFEDDGSEDDDDELTEDESEKLEKELADLQSELAVQQHKLMEMELDEPDDCTALAHDRWERRKDLLEAYISELEDQISEIEFLL